MNARKIQMVLSCSFVFTMAILITFPGSIIAGDESSFDVEAETVSVAASESDDDAETATSFETESADISEAQAEDPEATSEKDNGKAEDEAELNEAEMLEGAAAMDGTGDAEQNAGYSTPTAVSSVQSGAAVYSIPIVVPPGRKGVQPSLQLSYGSSSNNGWLGVGWDLNLGSIQRSMKRGIDYDGDEYVANGNELVSRSDWGSNYYGAKIEGAFSKYYYNSSTEGWEVTAKNGTGYYYGSDASSRLDNGLGTIEWRLDRIVDTNGNYMTVSYSKSDGCIYPLQIDYTGNTGLSPTKSVVFTLEDREDEILSYKTKTEQITNKRLQKITTYADGQLAREYSLTYTDNDISGQSQLDEVQTLGANGETTIQPVTLSYYDGNGGEDETFVDGGSRSFISYHHKVFVFGDIYGDGLQDRINICYDYIDRYEYDVEAYYYYWDNGQQERERIELGWVRDTDDISVGVADVDGDGFADIVDNGSEGIGVLKSNGNGDFGGRISTGITDRDALKLADINGDGLADLITHRKYYGYVYSYLADGSATVFDSTGACHTGAGGKGSGRITLSDVTGDGLPDLLKQEDEPFRIHVYQNNGDGTFSPDAVTTTFSIDDYPDYGPFFGDVNGDGLSDVAVYGTSRSGYYSLFFGTGDGTFIEYPESFYINGEIVGFADVSGDGLADIVYKDDWTDPWVKISKGNGEFYGSQEAGGRALNYEAYLSDLNGDGLADILSCLNQYCYESLTQPDGPANYLKRVKNSLRGKTTITYENSSTYPDNYCPFIVHPVSEIKTYDGTVYATSEYSYAGATYDYETREFWGFEQVEKTNPDGSEVKTYYLQTPYLKGRSDLVEVRDPSGNLLKSTEFTWDTYPADPVDYGFVKLNLKRTEHEDSSSLYSQEAYTYDDSNGNLLSSVITGTDSETITKTNTYVNKGDWVWRPEQVSVSGAASGLVRRTTNTYEANTGNLLYIESYNDNGTNPIVSMSYDAYGNVSTMTDAESNPATSTTYDSTFTYPVSITYPTTNGVIHEIEQTWDNRFGKILTSTGQNDFSTTYQYDGYGRLTQVDYPDGGEKLYTYFDEATPYRYVLSEVKEASSSWIPLTTYYDRFGRVARTESTGEDDKTIITQALYDEMGRNYRSEGPYFDGDTEYPYTEVISYDYLSRPLTVRSPDDGGGTVDVTIAYDGFSTTGTDPDGNVKTQTTDHLGRIMEVEEENEGDTYTTTYDYDASGGLKTVTDDAGNITTINYNTLGWKTDMTDPDMGYCEYTYDLNGNLITQTDAKSQVITFAYDALNRVTSKSYSTSDPTVTFTYDGAFNGIGLPYQVINADVTTTCAIYDAMGRTTSVTKNIAGDTPRTTLTTYDISGKVITTTYPDGYSITNSYHTKSNLLSQVTGSDGEVYAVMSDYEPTGKIGLLTHGNGTYTTYTYNPYTTRISDIVTEKILISGGTEILQDRQYEYSYSGDIDSITDNVTGVTYDYAYDDLHRLTGETNDGGYDAMSVAYDAIGNITEKTMGSDTFYLYYDSTHKHAVDYVQYDGTNYDYTYDANGNMTHGYDFTDLTDIKVRNITYNADNMPTSIYHGSGNTATIAYDGTGARAKKTVISGTTSTTYYIGEHFQVKDGTDVKYVFAGNLRVAQVEGTTLSYFHKDHLGSSTVMTDSVGDQLESTNYKPFGGQRDHTGTDTSTFKFTDQEFDAESGLYNYDARMYDPIIGRFISADSIVPDQYNPQSLNRYSYCLNNPLIYTDPSGHSMDFHDEGPYWSYWGITCYDYKFVPFDGGYEWHVWTYVYKLPWHKENILGPDELQSEDHHVETYYDSDFDYEDSGGVSEGGSGRGDGDGSGNDGGDNTNSNNDNTDQNDDCEWQKVKETDRPLSSLTIGCNCWWICRPDGEPVIWSGNWEDQQHTPGRWTHTSRGGLEGGGRCLCKEPDRRKKIK